MARKATTAATSSGAPRRPSGTCGGHRRDLVLAQRAEHLGVDEPRSDDVDGDRTAGDLARHRARETDEAGLGGGVVGLSGVAEHRDDRGDEDHPPAARFDHRRDRPLGRAVAGGGVGLEDTRPARLVHPQQQRIVGDARRTDEYLDRPELGFDRRERGLDLGGHGDVTGDRHERRDPAVPFGSGASLR